MKMVQQDNTNCIEKFRPSFQRTLYKAEVDVVGNHLSGILFIKKMPDSSTRLLFSNEAGFKYFDFEFSKDNVFKVYSILDKMDKESVKKTLKKDFQLILMTGAVANPSIYYYKNQKSIEKYFAYNEGKDYFYYITDVSCSRLLRMERGSNKRKVLEAYTTELKNQTPDSIHIHHTNFNFDITLKHIDDDAE
jgi:hypothetical protein